MSYKLTTFDGVTLPIGRPVTPVGTAPTAGQVLALPGGRFFDGRETQAPAQLPYALTYKALADGATLAAVDTDFLTPLRRRRGKLAHLVRRLADGSEHWCEARLLQMPGTREAKHQLHQDVELLFEILSPWYGQAHSDVFVLASTTTTIALANAGTAPVSGVRLTLTPGAALTGLRLAGEGMDWSYTGTVASGATLVIDGATWSVTNAGAGDWDHLQFNAAHTVDELLRLTAGGVTFVDVTRTGGLASDTLVAEWSDCWE